MHYKVWDEITFPFPNFNSAVEVWEWTSKFIPQFNRKYDFLSMLGVKLIHVDKSGHCGSTYKMTKTKICHGVFKGKCDWLSVMKFHWSMKTLCHNTRISCHALPPKHGLQQTVVSYRFSQAWIMVITNTTTNHQQVAFGTPFGMTFPTDSINVHSHLEPLSLQNLFLGLYSLSGKKSYRNISRSIEDARLCVIIIVSF